MQGWYSPKVQPAVCSKVPNEWPQVSAVVLVSCARFMRYTDTEPKRWYALAYYEWGFNQSMPDSWKSTTMPGFDLTDFVVGWQPISAHPSTLPPMPGAV